MMKMSTKKGLALAFMVVLCLSLLCACGGGQSAVEPPKHTCNDVCSECGGCTSDCTDPTCATKCKGHIPTYTVTVVGAIKESTQQVAEGEKALKPADPTKAGCAFIGWFIGDTEYDWDTPITGNITITARFEKLFDVRSGSAVKNEDGSYCTDSGNTLITFEQSFSKGTLIGKLTPGTASDCGIVFGAATGATETWWENNDYYTVLINFNGTVIIAHVNNGWQEVGNSPKLEATYDPTREYAVKIQYNEGLLVVLVDDIEVYRNSNFGTLPGVVAGYRAAVAGTTFQPLEINENELPVDVKAEEVGDYVVRSGKLEAQDTLFVSKEGQTLAVNKNGSFAEGTLVAGIKTVAGSDNGIVFGLTESAEELYWEAGASYYFFFINLNGDAYLGKVNAGWTQCGNVTHISDFDAGKTYTLKVEWKDGNIKCYVDDALYIDYTDEVPLSGTKYGFRASGTGVAYGEITVSAEIEEKEEVAAPSDYHIASGSAQEKDGVITILQPSTLLTHKTGSFAEGTISAKIKMSTLSDSGIIFGLNDNGLVNYWEPGVDYYEFFLTGWNGVYLAKINGTGANVWNELKSLPWGIQTDVEYTLKVEWKDGNIKCYVDDVLCIDYTDANPLTGIQYGYRAIGTGVEYGPITVSAEIAEKEEVTVPNDYSIAAGNAQEQNGVITTLQPGTLLTHKTGSFAEGTISATIKMSELSDSGIVFGLNDNGKTSYWEDVDYYEFFLTGWGGAYLAKVNGTGANVWNELKSLPWSIQPNVEYTLKVEWKDGNIKCYVDDALCIDYTDANPLTGTQYGYRAIGAGVEYGPITVSAEIAEKGEVTVPTDYKVAAGNAQEQNGVITTLQGGTLLTHKTGSFAGGTLTADIKTVAGSDNGIVFGLNDNGKTGYWEDVSYYFFFINLNGDAYLGKVDNGWFQCGNVTHIDGFNVANTYTLKVEWNNGNIKCYVNDVLYIDYTDAAPLTGTQYGYRAGGAGVAFHAISVA